MKQPYRSSFVGFLVRHTQTLALPSLLRLSSHYYTTVLVLAGRKYNFLFSGTQSRQAGFFLSSRYFYVHMYYATLTKVFYRGGSSCYSQQLLLYPGTFVTTKIYLDLYGTYVDLAFT
jgi:hypothetical protein